MRALLCFIIVFPAYGERPTFSEAGGRKILRDERFHSDGLSLMQLKSREMWSETCDIAESCGQPVHWVFVTDCSAYQFNQGNLFLASAAAVKQPGNFTWIMYGCEREEQFAEMKKLPHPRAQVFFAKTEKLTHPITGEPYKDFQASNRPASMRQWWAAQPPSEEAISIVDPDMNFLRPVILTENPRDTTKTPYNGPWETNAVKPKHGGGAMYGLGCVFERFDESVRKQLCRGSSSCEDMANDASTCAPNQSSGPPWILHRDDATEFFSKWVENAILMHATWPDLLAEQASFGLTCMQLDIKNSLDRFWFLSAEDHEQPWDAVMSSGYDPCESRAAPDPSLNLPPLWHACSTWHIPHIEGHYRLHKNHVHKDILDCQAPLIVYPPQDSLKLYYESPSASAELKPTDLSGFIQTWGTCTYTNMINTYAAVFKKQFCEHPSLDSTFDYPGHAAEFLNSNSHLQSIFRRGGWGDVDYTVGKSSL